MRKYSVYQCDVCGYEVRTDGFPKDWFGVSVRPGSFYDDAANVEAVQLEKDCCCLECVNKTLKEFIGG